MIKPKLIISAGSAGFVLSFLISIISTHSFGHSLLRALIFGVVFAALAVGIGFLEGKFLGGEDSGNSLADGASFSDRSAAGSKVDITLSDDNLTDDGERLNFAVSANRQTMSPDDVKPPVQSNVIEDAGASMEKVPQASRSMASPSASVETTPAEESAFKPVSLGAETLSGGGSMDQSPVIKASASRDDVVLEGAAARRAQAKAEREADIKEVGELPDIGSFAPEIKSGSDDDIVVDSDFASDGVDEGVAFSSPSPASSAAVDSSVHDAETMAKAIKTLLKKED